jgi:hypothetical protein
MKKLGMQSLFFLLSYKKLFVSLCCKYFQESSSLMINETLSKQKELTARISCLQTFTTHCLLLFVRVDFPNFNFISTFLTPTSFQPEAKKQKLNLITPKVSEAKEQQKI